MTKLVHLAYYQHQEANAPLAVVRYTIFDVDNKPVDIQQIEYPNTKAGWNDFEDQVIAALESDVDTSILTTKSVNKFVHLKGYLDSIGYYTSSGPPIS